MAKVTLTEILSQYQSTDALNANFDAIETAIENTLSRDGTTPNQMAADVDLNSYDLLNVKAADIESLSINGTPVVATGLEAAELPDQSGHSGKYLTTNGTAVSWDNVVKVFTVDGDADGSDETTEVQAAITAAEAVTSYDVDGAVVAAYAVVDLQGKKWSISDELTISEPIVFTNGAIVARSDFSSASGFMLVIASTARGAVISNIGIDGGLSGTYTHYADCIQNNAKEVTIERNRIRHFTNDGVKLVEGGHVRVLGNIISKYNFQYWYATMGQDYDKLTGATCINVADADAIVESNILFLAEYPLEVTGGNCMFVDNHIWNFTASVGTTPTEYYAIYDHSNWSSTYVGNYIDGGTVKLYPDIAVAGGNWGKLFSGNQFVQGGGDNNYWFELVANDTSETAQGLNITGNTFSGTVTADFKYSTDGGTWATTKKYTLLGNTKKNSFLTDENDFHTRIASHILFKNGEYRFGEGSGEELLVINGGAGSFRGVQLETGGEKRFRAGLSTTAEAGSDVGSDLTITGYDDDGLYIDTYLTMFRDDGQVSYKGTKIGPNTDGGAQLGDSTHRWSVVALNRAALKVYTVAAAPSASGLEGSVIYVSNGDAGSPCLAVSNGTNWLRIALGAAISAT